MDPNVCQNDLGDRISHKHTTQHTQNMQNIKHKYHKDFIYSIMVMLKHKNIQLRR